MELRFENLTGSYWEIQGRAASDAEPQVWRVSPYAALTVNVSAGEWDFAQSVLPNGPARTTRATLEAGESYRWPLATLLSAASPASEGGPAAGSHD